MLNGGLHWFFAIVYERLLGHLEAGDAQVTLVERLGLIETVAVLSAHLICVQVTLSLPGCTIKEVHRSIETTGCHGCLASLGRLHRDIMVETTLVSYLLS